MSIRVDLVTNSNDAKDGVQHKLASTRVLVRSTAWNLVGQVIPAFVAIPIVPILVGRLGIERFGVLTLIWVTIGYFSLFDLGLGRAITQVIARMLGEEESDSAITGVAKMGLALMAIVGVVGACVMWVSAPQLAHTVLSIPPSLEDETRRSLYLIAMSLPFVITSSGLVGVLAAYQRFDIINWIRTPATVLTVLLPVAVTVWTVKLEWMAAIIVAARLIAWFAYITACFLVTSLRVSTSGARASTLKELIRLGGWMTISNTLGPFLVYLDRFVIVGLVSATAIAYYATPYEVITKLLILPGAIVGVLFGAFATTYVHDQSRTYSLFVQGTKYIFIALFPVILGVVLFAKEGLFLWLGADFAANSFHVLQILAIGVFINCLGHTPIALIQGAGRPEIVATFHAIELVLYVPALWYMTSHYGIEGAALVWTLRVALDTALLHWTASLLLPRREGIFGRVIFLILIMSTIFFVAFKITNTMAKVSYLLVVIGSFYVLVWKKGLLESERGMLLAAILRVFR